MSLLAKLQATLLPPPRNSPPLTARLGRTSIALDASQIISSAVSRYGVDEVQDSADLRRIVQLPRRPVPEGDALNNLIGRYTARLRKPPAPCNCKAKYGRSCVLKLNAAQAWGLHDLQDGEQRQGKASGLLGVISVGQGKTLLGLLAPLVVPNCQRYVLFVPANLRAQLLEVDWDFYGQHWQLPNLAGGRFFTLGSPVCHIVSYSELSNHKATDLLEKLKPDFIAADEVHNLRARSAARTKRFLRYMNAHRDTRFSGWSGTVTSRSIKDYGHTTELALGDGSPLPLAYPELQSWAKALDPSDFPAPIGELRQLCNVGEHVREGFARRLRETKGVVVTQNAADCGASLVISRRTPPAVPEAVTTAMQNTARTWARPDGEEMVDAIAQASCMRQLASGFYYRFVYPRGESKELIAEWFEKRQAWHRELREKLKHSRPHLDSPLLCTKAAIRFYDKETRHDPKLPVWESLCWPDWRDIREQVQHETETVWISTWLAEDAAAWCRKEVGVLWYSWRAFGDKVAELCGNPHYGGGTKASQEILNERGTRSIVASIEAHGTGKNLQAFSRSLVANVPPSGKTWEQVIGRLHRPGQLADEVTFELYGHTGEVRAAFQRALNDAEYIQQSLGTPQKLLLANRLF